MSYAVKQYSDDATSEPSVSGVVLELKKGNADAKGQRSSEGFILLQGSRVNQKLNATCPKNAYKQRELNTSKIDENGILIETILLSSPNEAASF